MSEIKDIRVKPQDFQMTGSAVSFGQTFMARIYAPVAEALASPNLLLAVYNNIRVGDEIAIVWTNPGVKIEKVIEKVKVSVIGYDGKRPLLWQESPIWQIDQRRAEVAELNAARISETPQPQAKPADPRHTLSISRRETPQGRGKPRLVSWDVFDGAGSLLTSFNNEEAAQAYVRDFGAPEAA